MSAPMAMEDTAMFDEDTAVLEPMAEARPPEATVAERTNSVEYVVPGTWDVLGNDEATVVEV